MLHALAFGKLSLSLQTRGAPPTHCDRKAADARSTQKQAIMAQQETSTKERIRTDLREPRRYKVLLHNDDFTTMEFVVELLKTVFFKTDEEAERLMLAVHQRGKAVVGVYTYDMAVSKVSKATRMARENGFPLRITYQPE